MMTETAMLAIEKDIKEYNKKYHAKKGDRIIYPFGITLVRVNKVWDLDGNY